MEISGFISHLYNFGAAPIIFPFLRGTTNVGRQGQEKKMEKRRDNFSELGALYCVVLPATFGWEGKVVRDIEVHILPYDILDILHSIRSA